MKKLLLFSILLFSIVLTAQEKHHRIKIYYNSQEEYLNILQSGITIDHGINKTNAYYESVFSDSDLDILSQSNLKYDILINDIQRHYLEQNNPVSPHYVSEDDVIKRNTTDNDVKYITPKNYNLGSMGGYLKYEEVLQELDDMYTYCQENGIDIITKRQNIADFKTKKGRQLQWLKVSDNPNQDEISEPQMLYTAVHHAREPTSIQQMIFYLWYLIENYKTDAEIKHIVDSSELFFIPFVNPDGYVYNQQQKPNGGGMTRKNLNGVDNNRNYSYVTPEGKETWATIDKYGEKYPGKAPFSEPENKAVRYFIENHNLNMTLNAHSHGKQLLFPFGYSSKPTKDDGYFRTVGKIMARENNYKPQPFIDLYPASATACDYMYGQTKNSDGSMRNKIVVFTPEIGDAFWLPKNRITSVCKDMVYTNKIAARISNNYAEFEDKSQATTTSLSFPVEFSLTRYGLTDTGYDVSITPISSNIANAGKTKTIKPKIKETLKNVITITLDDAIKTGDIFTFKLNVDFGNYIESIELTKTFEGTLSTTKNNLDRYISIYPNPVTDRLTINTPLSNYDYTLSNIQGQVLLNNSSNSGSKTLNYNNFSKGIYLLTVVSKGKQKTFKIIKQ